MVFIFGGAYQGKLDFALEKFGLDEKDVCRCTENDREIDFDKKVIYDLQEFTFGCIKRGEEPKAYLTAHMEDLREKVIICTDVSQGVVPIDRYERAWREENGRCMNLIAGVSDEVYRVFCGIGSKVK